MPDNFDLDEEKAAISLLPGKHSEPKVHLEYMIRTTPDPNEPDGARMTQRRYRDFEKLHAALLAPARRAGVSLVDLPKKMGGFLRNLGEDFAMQRQAALQKYLQHVVAFPQIWGNPLRLFLGLEEEGHSAVAADPSQAVVVPVADASAGGADQFEQQHAELRWIATRAQQAECGVHTDGTGFFKGSTLVTWLLTQALVSSREQAVPLAEGMRRGGLIEAVGQPVPFQDGTAQYRFLAR